MAGNIKGITVQIGGDTTGLRKSLADVNKDLKGMTAELNAVNKLLKLDPTNTTLLKQKQQLLNNEITVTEAKLKALKEAQATMDANGVDRNSEQYRALTREIAATEQQLQSLKRQAAEANTVIARVTAGAEAVAAGADKIYQKTKYLTLGIAAVGIAGVKASADLETGLSNVQALCGATADEMDLLREKAREMGEKTKFTATEAADAFSYMALAGWDTEQMLNGIDGIMNLAAASGEDLASVSDIVTDALTAFGLQAQDSAHFADVLAVAMSHSNTTVGALGEAFKYVAPLAGTAGYSIEDISVAMGLMANAGIKGSQAGTTLRQAIQNMVSPTKAQQEAMDALNLSLTNSDGSMKSFDEVIQMLRTEFAGLSVDLVDAEGNVREYTDIMADLEAQNIDTATAQKMELAATIFGSRGLSGMLSIVNATEESYEGLKDAIYGTVGAEESAAEAMAKIQLNNLNGQLTLLKSALQGAAITIGQKLTPYISKLVSYVQKATDWFNNLSDAQVETFMKIAGLIALIAPVAKIVSGIAIAVKGLMGVITALKAASSIAGFLGMLTGGQLAAVIALVVAIGVAVAALVKYIIDHWDEIKAVFIQAAEWFNSNVIQPTVNFFRNLWTTVSSFFVNLWEGIKSVWHSIPEWFNSSIIQPIVNFFSTLVGSITGFFSNIWTNVKTTAAGIASWFNLRVVQPIKNFFSPIVDLISAIFELAWTCIQAVWIIAAQWFNDNVIQPIVEFFTPIIQTITDVFTSAWNGAIALWQTVSEWFTTNVLTPITEVFTAIGEAISTAWETVKTVTTTAWSIISSAVSTAVTAVQTVITDIFTAVSSWISSTMETIKSTILSIWESVKSGLAAKIGNLKSTITTGFQNAVSGITNIVSNAWNWGRDLVSNFINGIGSMLGSLAEKVRNLAQTIKNNIGFSEPKEGPLSNFHTYAPDMIKLFSKGITDNLGLLEKAMSGMTLTVRNATEADSLVASAGNSTVSNHTQNTYGGISIIVNGAAGQDVNELADIIMDRLTSEVSRKEAVWA